MADQRTAGAEEDESGYFEPPAVGGEAATLLGSLERQRATLVWKCSELDAAALQVRLGASSVTLGGLLKHLAYMEDINFTRDLAGQAVPEPWCSADWAADPGWEWTSAVENSPAELHRIWTAAVARSRAVVAEALARDGLEQVCHTPNGASESLRRLLVDLIEEYARHTGHADLIRESIDGRIGEDPPGPARPYQL